MCLLLITWVVFLTTVSLGEVHIVSKREIHEDSRAGNLLEVYGKSRREIWGEI